MQLLPQASLPGGREPDVPWVTGMPMLPYKIATTAISPYIIVRPVQWKPLWAVSDTIVVLEHPAVQIPDPPIPARAGAVPPVEASSASESPLLVE